MSYRDPSLNIMFQRIIPGSSLSAADSDSECGHPEESECEDSFMVADGYLSADEGVRLEEEGGDWDGDGDAMQVDFGAGNEVDAAAAAGHRTAREGKCAVMAALLDKARRKGQPLVMTPAGSGRRAGASPEIPRSLKPLLSRCWSPG